MIRRALFQLYKKNITRKFSTSTPSKQSSELDHVKSFPYYLTLKWNGEKESWNFHYFWLRVNCPNSVHPKTKERIVGKFLFKN